MPRSQEAKKPKRPPLVPPQSGGKEDKRPPARGGGKQITNRGELEHGFGQLVEAKHAVNKAEVMRDQLKAKADQEFDASTVKPKQILKELEPPCEGFCREHRDELCEPGKKSAIVGPVTIEFRMNPPSLMTKAGEKIETEKLIGKIQALANKLTGNERKELFACVIEKPQLDQAALKKLPVTILNRLGLRIHQEERFTWKPNAER
ncbi:MAG: host-nuclease inhibitor Gam family protein [bacterium]|nr:host-nuclease inhibitor Gam family protein [bacterium]